MNYVTIKDIAKRLNVSISTVSRAFNDKYDIKKETKNLILKTAKEMGYRPNPMAKKLIQKRSYNVGIVVPEFINSFFTEVIIGAQEILFKKGYQLLISQSNESYETELKNIEALRNSMVDGFLISTSNETLSTEYYQKLINSQLPVVFFNRVNKNLVGSKVLFNDYKWAFFATEHLIRQGCENIFCLKGSDDLSLSHERVRGFLSALKKHKKAANKEQVIPTGLCIEDGIRVAEFMIEKGNIPDAIFAVNDLTAIGAMKVFKKHGYKVPQDIAFVGFTETKMASLIDPPLTSVLQPAIDMGRVAAELLIAQIESQQGLTSKTIVLNGELKIRESSSRL